MGNRSAIYTLMKMAPQLPSSMPRTTHRDTIPILGNRSAIYTLMKTVPQLPSNMPSTTRHRRTRPTAANRSVTCTRCP